MENKLLVMIGERRERRRGNIGVGNQEVQTISYKISYKNIFYYTENIANVL